ncbi:ATP synthase subunit gamma, mitochondrial-like [Hydractinia symbiolongicarpus]|uniref:ATP synthase subunit gamma, mitochondrial-like n=1 Tax=Hydractinia symbiolongicarpus TaxID=13093 RepID=UPI00254E02C2|nr:ATP synthase subunit gamma, mitochondrial-like [Hydractinia symbiolongicarpus]
MASAPKLFARLAVFTPGHGARNLSVSQHQNATLKDIRLRLKSVTNIQKITKTMQMVSAAKYARAERELKPARVYGTGATALYEKAELESDKSKPNHLLIGISSDRGLCGGIHSYIAKAIKAQLLEKPAGVNTKLIVCGDKAKAILQRTHANDILFHFSELGRKPPLFEEASFIAENILESGYEFDVADLLYNKFKSVVSYNTTPQEIFSFNTLNASETMLQYDDVDEDVLRNYHEFSLANIIFYGMKESACSEQSARMTAMDNATKNAGEMIGRLQITYNRTRQAVITTELIEIISGSVALETED